MYGNAENIRKTYESFGERLTARMKDRHITQAQLSSELKIPKGTVSNWMNGKRLPRAGAMDALCRYLQCTRADLMDDPEELTAPPQTVQEPAGAPEAGDLKYVLDALDEAGYGHLRGLVEAAAQADESCYDFVIGILKRNPKKK